MINNKEQKAKETKREVLLSIAAWNGVLEVELTSESRKLLQALYTAAKANSSLFCIFYTIVVEHIARSDNPSIAVSDFLSYVDKAVKVTKGEDTLQDPEGILTHDS